MGLTVALNNALTGLNVNQQQLTVLSQNIANANTPGYSKQTAQQDSIYLDGVGQGVNITGIRRKVDEYLTQAVQTQNSVVSNTNVINDYSSRIQLLLGNPGNQNSIDSFINTFYNSVQSLSQTPQNTTAQQTAVNNGVSLANQLSGLATSLRELQFQADQDIARAVTAVNIGLNRLSELNTLIYGSISLGKSVAELEDQRDSAVKDIGQYINISTFVQRNGHLSATTGSGIPIIDNSPYKIFYTPASSPVAFSDGSALGSMSIFRVDSNGNTSGDPLILVSAGEPANIKSVFTSGTMAGLMEMRDRQIPAISSQLDNLASNLRDQLNTIHNSGNGYPGATSFTGTRPVFAQQINQWSGKVRIAVLDSSGQPIASPYPDEPNGLVPLVIDLENLDTQSGIGNPSVQGIIDTFNQYYGTPQNKIVLGNLNNIQIASNTASLPASPPRFNFDFNLNNISGTPADFFVTDVKVKNNNGIDITSVTSTVPNITLDTTRTYVTSAGSSTVTVNTASSANLSNGQVVFLSTPPGLSYDGIPGTQLGGYFKISNVSSTSFQITAAAIASAGADIGVAGQSAIPAYARAETGGYTRTVSKGLITADLTADTTSPFYTISINVGVQDAEGIVSTSIINYRINNQQPNILNKLIGAETLQGNGKIVFPTASAPVATAILVDENGLELPKLNGIYTNDVPGFLKIIAGTSTSNIAIDSMNSQELGNPTVSPVIPGSKRSFSHYFDLNNFFISNKPISTGDTRKGSALKLAVESRFRNNPGLLSLGQMIKSSNPVDSSKAPNYTYQLNPGDNSIITKLSALSNAKITFTASGGLGATIQNFTGYAGQIIGSAATNAVTSRNNNNNANSLMQGYEENASAISGVNLDTELANTVIYQNAYAASARVITVANQLFETLLSAFR